MELIFSNAKDKSVIANTAGQQQQWFCEPSWIAYIKHRCVALLYFLLLCFTPGI